MSFETVVRPFVYRPIRLPAPALPIAPEDKPEQGVAVLRGLGGKLIDLTLSETSGWSKSKAVETQRQVDVERIYQKEKDPQTGKETINKDNYVDVERVNKIWAREGDGTTREVHFADPPPYEGPPELNNVEILEKDVIIKNPEFADEGEGGPP